MTEREEPPPGYKTQSPDVDYWTERKYFEYLRTLQPWERMRLVSELNRAEHRRVIEELKTRYPEAREEELDLRAAALRYGDDLVKRLTGFDALR